MGFGNFNPEGPQPAGDNGGGTGSGGLIGTLIGAGTAIYLQNRQTKANKDLAEFQDQANQRYLQQQLEYNTPASQMRRFQEAGLNPNLVYGQGNPGNQSSPQQYPAIQPTDYARLMQIVPLINQTRLTDAQVQATNARTRQSGAMTQLNTLQAQVMEKNPLLNDGAYKAIIDGLKSTAELKAAQSDIEGQKAGFLTKTIIREEGSDYYKGTQGEYIMQKQLEILEQKFKLDSLTAEQKAEVLKSQDFKNAILEVQKNFMTEGAITPQHILQFIQLILMKSL